MPQWSSDIWDKLIGVGLVVLGWVSVRHIRQDDAVRDRVTAIEASRPTRLEVDNDFKQLRTEIESVKTDLNNVFNARFDAISGHVQSVHEDVKKLIGIRIKEE